MTLTLEALRRAGPRAAERHAVVAGFFASRRAASPFGPYAVRGSGATTLSGFARYRVRGGRVAPDR
jgi:hypothetical protein